VSTLSARQHTGWWWQTAAFGGASAEFVTRSDTVAIGDRAEGVVDEVVGVLGQPHVWRRSASKSRQVTALEERQPLPCSPASFVTPAPWVPPLWY
jgi:hypothetical protein